MRDNRINYTVVGFFVLLMTGALIVSLAMLTGRTGPTDTYYAVYDNVSGLGYGTQVLYEGYPIGQVEAIEPLVKDGEMRFRVAMSVREGWYIPADSVATITASGLLSAVVVEISGGESKSAVKPGGEIPAGSAGNMFAVFNDVATEFNDLSKNNIKPLLSNLNQQVELLGRILENDAPALFRNLVGISRDFSDRTPRIAENVEVFSDELRASGERMSAILDDENLARIDATIAQLDQATRSLQAASAEANRVLSEENVGRVDVILANLEATSGNFSRLSGDLMLTRERLDAMMATVDGLIAGSSEDVRESLRNLRYSMEVVSRSVGTIMGNLEGTSRNIHEFSRQVRQNPAVLIGGTTGGDGRR